MKKIGGQPEPPEPQAQLLWAHHSCPYLSVLVTSLSILLGCEFLEAPKDPVLFIFILLLLSARGMDR